VTSTCQSVCCATDVADFEIGSAVALTREHPLVSGGETGVVTNALQRPQDMVEIRSMLEAGVELMWSLHLHHPLSTEGHGTFAKGARAGLLVSPKN
jgi:hypothetical protein